MLTVIVDTQAHQGRPFYRVFSGIDFVEETHHADGVFAVAQWLFADVLFRHVPLVVITRGNQITPTPFIVDIVAVTQGHVEAGIRINFCLIRVVVAVQAFEHFYRFGLCQVIEELEFVPLLKNRCGCRAGTIIFTHPVIAAAIVEISIIKVVSIGAQTTAHVKNVLRRNRLKAYVYVTTTE